MARAYLNFDVTVIRAGDGYEVRIASPAGDASASFTVPLSTLELENFRLKTARPASGLRHGEAGVLDTARTVGTRLYRALFDGEPGERLRDSLNAARQNSAGLRIRVAAPAGLASLPWEYLYSPELDRFISISAETPIVRFMEPESPVPPALTIAPPLRVLLMVASPTDYPTLDAEQECGNLTCAVADVVQRGLVTIDRLEDGSLSTLQRSLRRQEYHIVHFVGHGTYDERTDEGMLIVEAPDGRGLPVTARRFGALLHDHPTLRLVVLNACQAGRVSASDPAGGVAQALLRARIPGVIAMQYDISDEAASIFAHEFYDALAGGYPVDAALGEARKAIYSGGASAEWGTPVLYSLSADQSLFKLVGSPVPLPSAPAVLAPPLQREEPRKPSAVPLSAMAAGPRRSPAVAEPPAPVAAVAPPVANAPAPVPGMPLPSSRERIVIMSPAASTGVTSAPAPRSALRNAVPPVLLLATVFVVNLAETALENQWWPTATDRALEFASALQWAEGGAVFQNHDVTNPVAKYGFSIAYFFLFPMLGVATAWGLARHRNPRALQHFAVALSVDYALSLPFFLAFPVPERWAYPNASAILLSDLWSTRLIEWFRPMSALDNCFPSFHTSMTVVMVLCCYLSRLPLRTMAIPLGAMVLASTYALGVHWVGDVVAGTAIGLISVAVATRVLDLRAAPFAAAH